MPDGNLLLIQAGGPTQVLNETLCAVIDEQRLLSPQQKVYGARRALQGFVHGDFCTLHNLTTAQLDQIRRSPGAALGSSRLKPSEEGLEAAIVHLNRLDIHQIVFIGGNGTMHAAEMVCAFARACNYDLQVIGAPKTIDNDIGGTDRCPGYGSAARYIAQSTRDLGLDLRSLPQPVSILETMGRDVGWVAAASVLARQEPAGAPHLLYIPEVPFDLDCFLSQLDTVLRSLGWAVVVVAEGIRDKAGQPVYQNADPSMADAVKRPLVGGVGRYLAETAARALKVRCRDEKPGLLGRASMLHVSAQDRADAQLVGRAAYQGLAAGESEKMIALTPLAPAFKGDLPFSGPGCILLPLAQVTGAERAIPKEWLCSGPLPIQQRFTDYLRPLAGELLEFEHVFDY